jgi:apolipoprotein D and lipocalin family protein
MNLRTKQGLIVVGAVLAAATFSQAFAGPNADLTTVPSVDLGRYTGRWYEIARYPNRFQKQCTGNVTANYRQLADGKIEVVNECRKSDGKLDVAKGKAKVSDTNSNAKLRVTFFWPFYGDYWIIGLDPEYRWAVVGEPSRKYLWILSRTPELSAADNEAAMAVVRSKGYDSNKLVMTPQH